MLRAIVLIMLGSFFSSSVLGDTWSYEKEVTQKEFIFGDVKFTIIRDTMKNDKYPDFTLKVEKDGNLEAKYRGVAFDTIYPSKNNRLFVGLRNHGLPGTALIILGPEGQLVRELKHGHFQPKYCDESVSIIKEWVSEDPKVEFTYAKIGDDYEYVEEITFLDCRGERVSLTKAISEHDLQQIEMCDESSQQATR